MRRSKARISRMVWKNLILVSLVSTVIVTAFWATTASGDLNQSVQTAGIGRAPRSERGPMSMPIAKWTLSSIHEAGNHVIADIDGDGQREVIVDSSDVYCLSGTGGVKWISRSTGGEYMTPAVGDVDGDGMQEVVMSGEYKDHKLCCLNSAGGLEWMDQTEEWFVETSPVIADVDGDSKPEIITGCEEVGGAVSLSPKVYCFNGTGGVKWSYLMRGHNNVVVGDVDLDSKLEIFAGSSDGLYCLNASGGLVWSSAMDWASAPTIIDIDQDGKQEILVGAGRSVYCLNGSGDLKWVYGTLYPVFDVTSGDVDVDGSLELIARSTYFPSHDSALYCLTGFGALKWSYTPDTPFGSPPVVGDVDGDNQPEIVAGSIGGPPDSAHARDHAVYCLNGSGALEWKYPVTSEIYSRAEIADVDGDSRPEIIVTALFAGKVYCLSTFASPPLELNSVPFVIGGLVGAVVAAVAVGTMRRRRDRMRAGAP